jgi:hypothetical protein
MPCSGCGQRARDLEAALDRIASGEIAHAAAHVAAAVKSAAGDARKAAARLALKIGAR